MQGRRGPRGAGWDEGVGVARHALEPPGGVLERTFGREQLTFGDRDLSAHPGELTRLRREPHGPSLQLRGNGADENDPPDRVQRLVRADEQGGRRIPREEYQRPQEAGEFASVGAHQRRDVLLTGRQFGKTPSCIGDPVRLRRHPSA